MEKLLKGTVEELERMLNTRNVHPFDTPLLGVDGEFRQRPQEKITAEMLEVVAGALALEDDPDAEELHVDRW